MGCGITTVKYLLFIFNLIFALCGLAILIAGALSYANIDKIDKHLQDVNISGSPIALIVVGSIVFVVAFYGCCGAIRESHCMVITFAVFLLVILIAEIAIGIVAFVNRDGWDNAVNDSLSKIFSQYDTNGTIAEDINDLQRTLECCGLEGPGSWEGRTPIPVGCCVTAEGRCEVYSDSNQVFQDGCEKKLKEFIDGIGLLLGALAIAVGVVEITGVVFALCLASSIKNLERRVY
ncbi:CD63 antigen-like isoform X2 [Zootermopsis nevadensis]|uniref:CD63 antigen-like isoform X2 n=1 Tax=Zootermopsis nevadensis TaxID=136037 RepID=UPI000B8E27E1|nr:CD63 antigen-like isoform X2 [Zootermopsis nevadensis]